MNSSSFGHTLKYNGTVSKQHKSPCLSYPSLDLPVHSPFTGFFLHLLDATPDIRVSIGDACVNIVFVLSVFIGFQVIWNVAHSLHTPLMAVTNAISSIIILGAVIQIGSSSLLITLLAALAVFMASVNIFGGFLVTRRMLAMFQKS